jgi:LDH2 family malate/lactate/ureidoglycolate dehydrogenase
VSVHVTPAALQLLIAATLEAAGAPADHAGIVAASLVDAELEGHASHGAIRVVEYLGAIERGRIVPGARPRVARESATTLLVDGGNGFGQVAAGFATERVVEKALAHDIAIAGVHHCGHVGTVGAYVAAAARSGLVAMAFVNGGGTTPRVAPFGGGRPVFGTNPIAAALPRGAGAAPIVTDFSTAVVASGKIRVQRDRGEPLPDGWILDHDGRPSTDPADYYDGGMLLPAAGHKGYGLALLAEVLGGLLTTAGSVVTAGAGSTGNGTCIVAINPGAFVEPDVFAASVREMGDAIKRTPPAAGVAEVLLPGEPEQRARVQGEASGLEIATATWHDLEAAARKLGVEV